MLQRKSIFSFQQAAYFASHKFRTSDREAQAQVFEAFEKAASDKIDEACLVYLGI